MHYLVDGYNLLFRVFPKKKLLEESRRALMEEFDRAISSSKLDVTLVFDGAKTAPSPTRKGHFKSVGVIYTTAGQSADDYILEEISLAKHPADFTVVTNDRELKQKSHLLGAHFLTIEAFLSLLNKKQHQKRPRSAPIFQESEKEFRRLLEIFENKYKEF